jgi:dipeptidyl aminopeptidase/acylaminoacyl peptidase
VSLFGPVDLVALARDLPPAWQRFIGPMAGDPALLEQRSPARYAAAVRCAVMLVQGDRDPRVPRQATEDFVHALRSAGVPVEYLLLETEGHGFGSRASELRVFREVARFLSKWLCFELDDGAPGKPASRPASS